MLFMKEVVSSYIMFLISYKIFLTENKCNINLSGLNSNPQAPEVTTMVYFKAFL